MKRTKGGFTLIEAVICTALIAVITAGFLSMTLTGLSITEKMNAYAQETAALVSYYESGKVPDGQKVEVQKVSDPEEPTKINVDDWNSIGIGTFYLQRAEVRLEDADSGLTYYYFGNPE